MKASNLSSGGTYSFLFKGPFGFGKTLAAASFALEGPVYISYWDKKSPVELVTFFTEKRFGSLAKKILDNIEYDVYGPSNASDYLNKMIDWSSDCRYFAVINDSLTFMTAAAVNWSMNFGKDPKLKKKMKDVLPSWDEYKVETSLITQCLDLGKLLPCHVIWTAHPLPTTKVEGSGSSINVSKINSLVSYGSKVAGIVPGSFTEIYHFTQKAEWSTDGKSNKKYIVSTEAIGDEFAKSPLLGDFNKELDITDKLFYQVWKEALDKSRGIEPKIITSNALNEADSIANPFKDKKEGWKT